MLSKTFPFLSIVILMFSMVVFMFATPPLLVLKHDTPVDGRFIRGLFNLYYIGVMSIAAVGAAGCVLIGQRALAVAMGGLVVVVFGIRRWVIANMDRLRDAITRGESTAVPRFRRLHMTGMVLNVVQLGAVAWVMTRLAA